MTTTCTALTSSTATLADRRWAVIEACDKVLHPEMFLEHGETIELARCDAMVAWHRLSREEQLAMVADDVFDPLAGMDIDDDEDVHPDHVPTGWEWVDTSVED